MGYSAVKQQACPIQNRVSCAQIVLLKTLRKRGFSKLSLDLNTVAASRKLKLE